MPKKTTKSTKALAPEAVPQPETIEIEAVAEKTAKPKPSKARKQAKTPQPVKPQPVKIEDPVGDLTDGEARAYLGDVPPEEKMPASGEADPAFEKEAVKAKPEELAPDEEPKEGIGAGADEEAPASRSDAPPEEKMPASGESDPAFEKEAVKTKPEELAPDEEPEGGIGAGADDEAEADAETDEEVEAPQAPPVKLERLQKILSQAGISSRRRAEELITEGRVQVNGAVVTTLGTKADAARDHIRVDGKLLHGAERLRYFELNKPKGFVTTVKDPEGRPTVMQFFEKTRERLYPVGRLDYQSEGLLLVTNDGDLANRLTRAGSGVEKTYLVKVAGRPTEEELETLRGGVAIEQGAPGSKKVRTAPARLRQVRTGDNPWFEVVLIEGRNRELRKMFSAIGHFVEKIRRVGYGPLVLDVEPGKMRELDATEVDALRRVAEGKPVKGKARGKRDFERHMDEIETIVLPSKPEHAREARPAGERSFGKKPFAPRAARGEFRSESRGPSRGGPRSESRGGFRSESRGEPRGEFRPKRTFGRDKPGFGDRPREDRPRRDSAGEREFRPAARRNYGKPAGEDRGFNKDRRGPREGDTRGFGRSGGRGPQADQARGFRGKPAGQDRAGRAGAGFGRTGESSRPAFKPRFDRPGFKPREGGDERASGPRTGKPKFQGARNEGRSFDREKRFGARSTGFSQGDRPRTAPGGRSFGKDERPRTGPGNRSFGQNDRPRAGRARPPRTEGGFKSKSSFKPGGPSKARGTKPGRPQRRTGGGFGKKRG